MKIRIILVVLFLTMVFSAPAQYFEGKITYQNKFKSKLPNVTDDQFNTMMGTIQEYYVKGGNFKSTANGSFFQWQIYLYKDNKLYNKFSNSETLLWIDGGTNTDEVIKSEYNKGAVTILGYLCDEIILTCKSGLQKYYFNSQLALDVKSQENLKFSNWSAYISKSKSLPLKMVIENQQFILESIATEIKPSTLNDAMFTLPPNAALAKSPY
jgi:hypothetical protein